MLKRAFGTSKPKEVKRVGVYINLAKPLDIYDMRKSLIGRFISAEKKIPFQAFLHSNKENRELDAKNRDIMEKLDFKFDKTIEISQESIKDEIETTLNILRDVAFFHLERQD